MVVIVICHLKLSLFEQIGVELIQVIRNSYDIKIVLS